MGPTLPPPHSLFAEAQKSNFHTRKSSFKQKELFDDFFLVLASGRTTEKMKQKKKMKKRKRGKKEKQMKRKNGKTNKQKEKRKRKRKWKKWRKNESGSHLFGECTLPRSTEQLSCVGDGCVDTCLCASPRCWGISRFST